MLLRPWILGPHLGMSDATGTETTERDPDLALEVADSVLEGRSEDTSRPPHSGATSVEPRIAHEQVGIGRRVVVLANLGLSPEADQVSLQAAGGIAGSYFQLMLARIGLGATEAPCFPSATRSTSDWFDVKDRGRPSGLYTSGAYIGPTIAPPILTGLMLAFDWRVMFIVMGVAGVVAAGFWFLVYRDPKLQQLDAQDEAYLRANRTAKSSVSLREWTALFRFKAMWVLMLGAFCTGYITWMYQTWLPAYLEMQQHISIAKTGFLASVPLICAFFGALTGGWLSDWMHERGMELIKSRRLPLIVGLVMSAVFTGLAAMTTSATIAVTCIAASMFFMQFGITCKWILVTAVTPQAYCASAASNQNFAGFLGGTLSPIATGFIVDQTGSFVLALSVGAVITLIGAVLFQFFMNTVIDEAKLERYAGIAVPAE